MPISANFLQGPNGREKRGFANFAPAMIGNGWGYSSGGYGGPFGNLAHRDRNVAATISNELAVSSSTLKVIVDVLTTSTVGPTGLTLSAKVDASAIGITEAQGRELNNQLERKWADFCGDPDSCDITGRFDFHSLATQFFQSYLLSGEGLAFLDVAPAPGVKTFTKVALSDPRIIDLQSKTNNGSNVFNGIQFSAKTGRWEGLWCRRIPVGTITNPGTLQFVAAKTKWGRPKIAHLFDAVVPNQVRGLSPLTNALSAVASRELLNELSIAGHAAQVNFALTIESDAPADVVLNGLEIPNEPNGTETAIAGALTELRAEWYGQKGEGGGVHPKLTTDGGQAVHLLPGDKLRLTQPAKLAENYESFNRNLTLEASRASGAAASDVTGDYSEINFSAARMEQAQPFRLALKRRREIVGRFYSIVYRAVVEEWIARGMIELPEGAAHFWDCPNAYCKGEFLGVGVVEADKLKAAQASVLRLANHMDTLTDVLAADGKDFAGTTGRLSEDMNDSGNGKPR
jgi:lambda family phage portal protein